MVAAPPTTVPPSGPAAAGLAVSAMSAAVVSRNLLKRGCMARSRYSLALRMKKNRVFLRGPWSSRPGRAVVPTKPWPCATCVWNRGKIMEPALVEKAVELRQAKCRKLNGNIVAQLEQGLDAAVRDELGRVKTAPKQPPAIAAQLRYQERGHRVLPVHRDQPGQA